MNIKRYLAFVIISLLPHAHNLLAEDEVNTLKDLPKINAELFLETHSLKTNDNQQDQESLNDELMLVCEELESETNAPNNQQELDEKLILAVEQKDLTQVKTLLAYGAKGDSVHFFSTAIHKAALIGDEEIIQALLNAGADKNVLDGDGATPLHYAVKNGHLITLKILLAAGAKTEISDHEGWTPFHYALLNNDAAAAEELLLAETRKLIFRV